jgi:SAM-dependent methyltransferase
VGEARTIAGIPYVTFDCAEHLPNDAVDAISNLSSIYALFEIGGDSKLQPIELRRADRYDDDLLTIQRYTGKTNEAFTKLLVNVAAAVSVLPADRPPRLLDPLCGRGTSLNQALMYGFDAAGVELDGKAVDAYEQFLKTWLQDKRLKHEVNEERLRRDGKIVGRKFEIEIAVDKAAQRAGIVQKVTVVQDDTVHVDEHFRRNTFDVLVADLPYGVQHGSGRAGESKRSRRPEDLLRAAIEGWIHALRPGAGVGLSWNTHVCSRATLVTLLSDAGLDVLDDPPFSGFSHRVDAAIQRDLVVARKPQT